jgi:hypothetical protein
MLPLVADVLRLEVIAEYWSREINHVRLATEIFDELLEAFWHDRLTVCGKNAGRRIDRQGILKIIRRRLRHPGFTIVGDEEDIPVRVTRHPDGSVLLDSISYIVLPSDESTWTDDLLKNAYCALAAQNFLDFDDLVKPALSMLSTTREALGVYCDSVPYPRPRFWYPDSKQQEAGSFGGRPTVMRQIIGEMNRRAEHQTLAPSLREEAQALRSWAEKNIDEKKELPKPRSIENGIREAFNGLKRTAAASEHET